MALKYTKSERGTDLLVHKSYMIYSDKQINSKVYWKCVHLNKFKFRGRVHVKNDKIVKSHEHSHDPDIAQAE